MGVCLSRVSAQGGVCLDEGVSAYGEGGSAPAPPCRQTDACENITLPQTSFAGGNKHFNRFHMIYK